MKTRNTRARKQQRRGVAVLTALSLACALAVGGAFALNAAPASTAAIAEAA